MNRVLVAVLMLGMTGGAYAADFSDLAVKAADIKVLVSADTPGRAVEFIPVNAGEIKTAGSFSGTIKAGRYSNKTGCRIKVENASGNGTVLSITSPKLKETEDIMVVLSQEKPFHSLCLKEKVTYSSVKEGASSVIKMECGKWPALDVEKLTLTVGSSGFLEKLYILDKHIANLAPGVFVPGPYITIADLECDGLTLN